MRGADEKQASMLCLLSPEDRVPKDHPLRRIKKLADEALAAMSPLFDEMYSDVGRPSVPPERLIKGEPAHCVIHRPQRAAVLRAARLQPVVSVVPRHEHGRAELRPDGVHEVPSTVKWSLDMSPAARACP